MAIGMAGRTGSAATTEGGGALVAADGRGAPHRVCAACFAISCRRPADKAWARLWAPRTPPRDRLRLTVRLFIPISWFNSKLVRPGGSAQPQTF